jgi:8-oxo-dGTP diphosphatase
VTEATLCLLLRDAGPAEVLLGLKQIGFGTGKYVGIGGKVDAGETVARAAVRELAEEIGVRVAERDLVLAARITFLFPARPAWDLLMHVFLITRWAGDPIASREIVPTWFPRAALPFDQMWHDAAYWLPQVLAGQEVTARFVYGDDNETVREAQVVTGSLNLTDEADGTLVL